MYRFRPKRVLIAALFALGFFGAFLVGESPHLVHHLFEPSERRTDCAFASAAERSPELSTALIVLIPPPVVEIGRWAADQSTPATLVLSPSDARAPPLLAS